VANPLGCALCGTVWRSTLALLTFEFHHDDGGGQFLIPVVAGRRRSSPIRSDDRGRSDLWTFGVGTLGSVIIANYQGSRSLLDCSVVLLIASPRDLCRGRATQRRSAAVSSAGMQFLQSAENLLVYH